LFKFAQKENIGETLQDMGMVKNYFFDMISKVQETKEKQTGEITSNLKTFAEQRKQQSKWTTCRMGKILQSIYLIRSSHALYIRSSKSSTAKNK
jgi:TnpA family transposase